MDHHKEPILRDADPPALPPPVAGRPPLRERLAPLPGLVADRLRTLPKAVWIGPPAVIGLLLALFVAWDRGLIGGVPDVKTLASYQPGGAAVVLDRDGKPLAEMAPVEGALVPLAKLPKHVPQAFLAAEDQRFYDHGAFELRRGLGALWANLRAGGAAEGSSTITMQLARNAFPDRLPAKEKTLGRKLLEVKTAREIERRFSKDEILELYLNHIYFGNGARGVAAAAQHYFAKDAKDLTIPEAALLAALPKAPSHYDPRRHPEQARERRDLVIGLMQEQERLTPAEAAEAKKAELGVVPRRRALADGDAFAAYFVDAVRDAVEDRLGEGTYAQKLRIHTTLDRGLQAAAEQELESQLRRLGGPAYDPTANAPETAPAYLQGAVVVLDAQTGDVQAWVGGRDFRQSRFDRVTDGSRQMGSTFKPFVYAVALSSGHGPSEHLEDTPLTVSLGGRQTWSPTNYDGGYAGQVTLRDALVFSKNVPTVRLSQATGVDPVAALAERAELKDVPHTPAMVLGTVAASPLQVARAYTAFARLGTTVEPRLVQKIEGADGNVLWEAPAPETHEVMDASTAYLVTDRLSDAVNRGTGTAVRAAGVRGPVAGKTGTTNDGTDAWFVGYTPDRVGVVWVGYDKPHTIGRDASGGHIAAPVFGRIFARAVKGTPRPWNRPVGVTEAMVDPATGARLSEDCLTTYGGAAVKELFLAGALPAATCPTPVATPYPEGSPYPEGVLPPNAGAAPAPGPAPAPATGNVPSPVPTPQATQTPMSYAPSRPAPTAPPTVTPTVPPPSTLVTPRAPDTPRTDGGPRKGTLETQPPQPMTEESAAPPPTPEPEATPPPPAN